MTTAPNSDLTFRLDNGKAQWVRVADVFVIGPLMMAGGFALGRKHPISGLLLTLFGVGTIFYNARNYTLVAAHGRAEESPSGDV